MEWWSTPVCNVDVCFKEMSKNDKTYVTYFVELCGYIIANVSNNVQTQS